MGALAEAKPLRRSFNYDGPISHSIRAVENPVPQRTEPYWIATVCNEVKYRNDVILVDHYAPNQMWGSVPWLEISCWYGVIPRMPRPSRNVILW